MSKKFEWTISSVESQIKKWENIKNIIERSEIKSTDDFDTKVFKLYLKHTSVVKVAKILNDEGFRIPSTLGKSRNITSKDISEIITSKNINDIELSDLVKNIFKDAKAYVNGKWN